MTAKPELKKIIDRIQNLPTLPPVVTKILKLVNDPDSSATDLNKILSKDQSLTMKVMKLVNSSFYGYAGRIKSLQQAVVILGFETLRSVALSASVFDAFGGKGKGGFDREAFWKHSLATAIAARLMAQKKRWKDPEEAFTAGLLHDIGKVVLDQYVPEDYGRVIEEVKGGDKLIFNAEREILGLSHAQVGRWLSTKWNLPPELVDAVFYHHQPAYARKAPELTAVCHVADILSRTLNLGSGGDPLIPPLDPAGWEKLKMTDADLKVILDQLPEEFAKGDLFLQLAGGG